MARKVMKYQKRVFIGRDAETGVLIQKRIKANTSAELKKIEQDLHREYALGADVNDTTLLSAYIEKWLDSQSKKRQWEKATRHRYKGSLRLVRQRLGKLELRHIKNHHLDMLLDNKIDPTWNNKVRNYKTLKMVMRSAVNDGLIGFSPFEKHDAPKFEKSEEADTLTKEEVRAILAECNQDDFVHRRIYRMVQIASTTGMRFGEIANLRIGNVHFHEVDEDGKVKDGYGRVEDSVAINPDYSATKASTDPNYTEEPFYISDGGAVKNHQRNVLLTVEQEQIFRDQIAEQENVRLLASGEWKHDDLLFSTRNGQFVHHRNMVRDLKFIAEGTTVSIEKVHWHTFRHSYATWVMNDVDNPEVQLAQLSSRLGHADIETTLRLYGHFMEDRQQTVASVGDDILSVSE